MLLLGDYSRSSLNLIAYHGLYLFRLHTGLRSSTIHLYGITDVCHLLYSHMNVNFNRIYQAVD